MPRFPLVKMLSAASLVIATCGTASAADELIRHPLPNNSTFPISAAVEVPSGLTTVYLSGQLPPVQDTTQPKDSPLAFGGETKAQTVGVLKAIEKSLLGLGLSLADVIKMQVYLVPDAAKGNKMDYAGFMEGYTQFYGAPAQPILPVRSVFQVGALANPGWLVEIEVVAVRKK